MTPGEWEHYDRLLNALARRHDCTLVISREQGATPAQLSEFQAFVNAKLPRSYRDFLEVHNGMSYEFMSNQSEVDDPFPFPIYSLYLFGTKESMRATNDFRNTVDAFSEREKTLIDSCIEFGNRDQVLHRLVFTTQFPRINDEFGIFEADIDRQTWLIKLTESIEEIELASSFNDFVERCLAFMLRTESDFAFWNVNAEPSWDLA